MLVALKDLGAATRPELHTETKLARSTVTLIVDELVNAGLVERLDEVPARLVPAVGRPVERAYALKRDSAYAIGIDVGHHRIAAALANFGQEIVLATSEVSVDHARDFERALDVIVRLVARLVEESEVDAHRIVAVGLGIPGPVDAGGRVRLERVLPGWAGVAVREATLGALRVPLPSLGELEIDNDANLGVLGESLRGALADQADGIYLRASHGIGAGLLIGGGIHRGKGGIAGELGHTVLGSAGPFCRVCKRRCLEALASSDAVLGSLPRAYADMDHDGLIAAANDGDAICEGALFEAGDAVGRVVGGMCNLINPPRLVVGGQLGEARAFVDGVRSGIAAAALEPVVADLEVFPSPLRGDTVPGLGGASFRINAELVGAVARAFERVDVQTALRAAGVDTTALLGV